MRSVAAGLDDQVIALVAAHFRVPAESVKAQSSLVYDLGADSSDVLDLCIQLSDRYDVELDTRLIARVRTVGDMALLVSAACGSPER